ncbi:MAG TPA: asparagine synthase (glutamine-hydrolyzing) [Gaiellaceae bacterium]|jgi:asparagine synthase (glutamine-hydrolysing)|nr:asparagine synthase (glutamine-hydrolyzing) [Gaiellaceae bacterium]
MCGIVGKVVFGGAVDGPLLHRMCGVMEHRGPDSRGVFVDGCVGLGVQRLAIIDRDGGDQPIFNEDGTVVVVLNGEIYNFSELRRGLERRGHRFSSGADTEVLAHLYEERGAAMVHDLRGMFAFAVWDRRRRSLLLARDRVGKKPLFWRRDGPNVWFASELRALLQDPEIPRDVDPQAVAAYLALQYVPHPLSIFAGVRKLPPATTMVADAAGERLERYWRLDFSRKTAASAKEIEEDIRHHIREATRIRLMSEVPLGAFLSGGIDSSAVVAAMADATSGPVKTFSIGFTDEDFDELAYARIVAERFGTEHHEFIVESNAVSLMPKIARHYGEPFADPSAIPSFYLAALTSRHVTVALNGDGGDENFAGYRRYVTNDMAQRLNWLPRPAQRAAPKLMRIVGEGPHNTSMRTRMNRLARTLAMTPAERYATWMSAFDTPRRQRLFTAEFTHELGAFRPERFLTEVWDQSTASARVDRMLDTDVQTYLSGDLLVKMDIATMAYSVEARSPFLDHRLMEFAASLPAEWKLAGTNGKRILKSALRGIVPDEVLDRPKMGFGVPLARWFRTDLRSLPSEVLLDPAATARGIFRRDEVERLIAEHLAGTGDHSLRLWVLLQLETWFREVRHAPALGASAT